MQMRYHYGEKHVTFPELLKKLRDGAGLSQSGLATASGMSLSAIHDYEQGKREPSMRNLFRLAKALGVTCEAFADCEYGDDKPTPQRGRPAKAKEPEPAPKRSRGRPRKGN